MNLSFKQINSLAGWLTFFIALFTYVSTLEPTVSFWDCGEYIATSVKLQVGHPPGAPVFQLFADHTLVLEQHYPLCQKILNKHLLKLKLIILKNIK